jgi:hypothetical protein
VSRTAVRLIALVLILLAASPVTAPFSAYSACDAQYKDDSAASKTVSDAALAPAALPALHVEFAGRVAAERVAGRVERHDAAPLVLRL